MEWKRLAEAVVTATAISCLMLGASFLAWRGTSGFKSFRAPSDTRNNPLVAAPKSDVDREYLRMMYGEQAEHARLHEELRGTATSLFVALIAGLLAWAVGETGDGHQRALIAGPLILATSGIGAVVSLKHYERYQMHLSRLRGFRKSLEKEVTDELVSINSDWTERHNRNNPITSWISLHILWNVIYGVTFLIGLSLFAFGSKVIFTQ